MLPGDCLFDWLCDDGDDDDELERTPAEEQKGEV